MAKNLKKDLQEVKKALKALSKKVEKLSVVAGKPEKQKPAKKAVATKTAKKLSAADTVLSLIKKSRNGIATNKLKEKTGFQGQKLHNAVYLLKKQGKIKSEKKGFYMKG
jgi:hypothetical protein